MAGVRVQGSGFRGQGSGVRGQGSGFRGQGSGFRVQGSGFRSGQKTCASPSGTALQHQESQCLPPSPTLWERGQG
ncbi:MAG: hypothetical protein EI684_07225, partial [Candidatus Viridilinea halotolerans]